MVSFDCRSSGVVLVPVGQDAACMGNANRGMPTWHAPTAAVFERRYTGWLKIKYPTGEYAISPQLVL